MSESPPTGTKAYGFRIGYHGTAEEVIDVVGLCVLDTGEVLGHWVSSDDQWLAKDLKNHADKRSVEYQYVRKCPEWLRSRIDETNPEGQ
jgi:hypothetical protein